MNPARVELLILDIDGVLTDGSLVIDPDGERAKRFDVHDGCAVKLWQRSGGKVAFLSGRDTGAVHRRAAELGIECVHTDVIDKVSAYEAILAEFAVCDGAVAYVGDDLPDLGPLRRAGFPVAVANAVPAVKRVAMYISRRPGGGGAVAEIIEFLLRKKNRWSSTLLHAC